MEMMRPLIEKALNLCFDDDIIRTVALSVFINEEKSESPVKSLQMLALEVLMKEKLNRDIESGIISNLVFREPLNLKYFNVRPSVEGLLGNLKRFFSDIWTLEHLRHQTCLRLRNDPHIMHAVLEQNFQGQDPWIDLTMTKTHMIIGRLSVSNELDESYDWYDPDQMVHSSGMIPNRENQEFDSFWAVKFFKLLMKKQCRLINLKIDGKGEFDKDYMENFLKNIIKSELSKKPEEGWEQAIEQGEKIIYRLNVTGWTDGDCGISYVVKTDKNYDEWDEMDYRLIHFY